MLTAMATKTSSRIVPFVVVMALAVASACSDQGAVKDDAPKPLAAKAATTPTSVPPLASGHGDAPGTLPAGHPPIDAGASAAPSLPPVPEGAGTGATA